MTDKIGIPARRAAVAPSILQQINPTARWRDLALPRRQMAQLRILMVQAREASRRGNGVVARFSGPSDTVKTEAAQVLARALKTDLYRISPDRAVGKYIGETEKNLLAVFAAAERSHGVLLFDEADALLGKRTGVKDSHDRYANLEVSYLLDRLEAYRGLAILSTDTADDIDPALRRRFAAVVKFPKPTAGSERSRLSPG